MRPGRHRGQNEGISGPDFFKLAALGTGSGQGSDQKQRVGVFVAGSNCARIAVSHHGFAGVLLSLRPDKERLSCRVQTGAGISLSTHTKCNLFHNSI